MTEVCIDQFQIRAADADGSRKPDGNVFTGLSSVALDTEDFWVMTRISDDVLASGNRVCKRCVSILQCESIECVRGGGG